MAICDGNGHSWLRQDLFVEARDGRGARVEQRFKRRFVVRFERGNERLREGGIMRGAVGRAGHQIVGDVEGGADVGVVHVAAHIVARIAVGIK